MSDEAVLYMKFGAGHNFGKVATRIEKLFSKISSLGKFPSNMYRTGCIQFFTGIAFK